MSGAKVDINAINAGLQLVTVALPQLSAAYAAYRIIWSIANPSKTEADFTAHLEEISQKNVDDADAILTAHGYVRDPATGTWSRPAAG